MCIRDRDIRRTVRDVVYAAEYVVEGGYGVVHKVHRLARDVGEVVRGAAHVAGDGVEPVGDVGGGVARVQQRDVEEVVQLALEDGGEILVISQFTLHASTKKGNRPSYIKAAMFRFLTSFRERNTGGSMRLISSSMMRFAPSTPSGPSAG